MKTISWNEFEQVELRAGTILTVEDFPETRKPAYKITADFGGGIGIKRSSAQVAHLRHSSDTKSARPYQPENYDDLHALCSSQDGKRTEKSVGFFKLKWID